MVTLSIAGTGRRGNRIPRTGFRFSRLLQVQVRRRCGVELGQLLQMNLFACRVADNHTLSIGASAAAICGNVMPTLVEAHCFLIAAWPPAAPGSAASLQ